MSQATAITTSPPVTVVCMCALTATRLATVSTSVRLSGVPVQNDVLPLPLILMNTMRGVAGFAALLQQNLILSSLFSIRLMQLWHGSSTEEFFYFIVEPPTDILCWCLLQCSLSTFTFQCGQHLLQWELSDWGCTTTTLQSILLVRIWAFWCCSLTHASGVPSSYSLCLQVGLPCATGTAVLQPFYQYSRAYSFGDSAVS